MPESIRRKLYTSERVNRSWVTLAMGLLSAGLAVAGVVGLNPDAWWKELLVVSLWSLAFSLLGTWIFRRKKWGLAVVTIIVGNLVLRRLGILNWVSVGAELLILGLITLIN